MKYYAWFYRKQGESYVEGLGSFSLIRLDGRLNRDNMEEIAARECKLRGYDGWRIARGQRLDNQFYLNAAVRAVA